MNWTAIFTSSVGKKLIMGITGISLVAFLIVHAGLNICVYADLFDDTDNGDMFNRAAHFMGSSYVIRALEIFLFLGIILHAVQGLILEFQNKAKRKKGYAVNLGERGSKWYSRSMGLLGTLLLLFLIMHIAHFWVPSRITGLEAVEGKSYHNLYQVMVEVFQNPFVVILYIVGCISLAYHLMHGFHSAFRTLGVHNQRYLSMIVTTGYIFSILISAIFASMPVAFYFGWVN